MSDLVKRLRSEIRWRAGHYPGDGNLPETISLINEAADEIERLSSPAHMDAIREKLAQQVVERDARIATLEAELAAFKGESPATTKRHPMQSIIIDDAGVYRFRSNAIVQFLLDNNALYDLNALARLRFSPEDHEQFAQLIGYSVSGFGDLDYASADAVAAADAYVDAALSGKE